MYTYKWTMLKRTDGDNVLLWKETESKHQGFYVRDKGLVKMEFPDVVESVDYDDIEPLAISGYMFWQNVVLLGMLFLGVACLCHIALHRQNSCKNSRLVVTVILVGLGHMFAGLQALEASRLDVTYLLDLAGRPTCVDYSFPSLLSVSAILLMAVHVMVRRHVGSKSASITLTCVVCVSMIVGLVMIFKDGLAPSQAYNTLKGQETIVAIDKRTEIVWSLCSKSVVLEAPRLVLEYGFLYMPVLLVALGCLFKWCKQHKEPYGVTTQWNRLGETISVGVTSWGWLRGSSDATFKITCASDYDAPCNCSHMTKIFVGLMGYTFVMLFIVRPTIIIYSYRGSGVFHDLIPGHLCILTYFVTCEDYLISIWTHKSLKRVATSDKKVELV